MISHFPVSGLWLEGLCCETLTVTQEGGWCRETQRTLPSKMSVPVPKGPHQNATERETAHSSLSLKMARVKRR